jgi:hypothetical protein
MRENSRTDARRRTDALGGGGPIDQYHSFQRKLGLAFFFLLLHSFCNAITTPKSWYRCSARRPVACFSSVSRPKYRSTFAHSSRSLVRLIHSDSPSPR